MEYADKPHERGLLENMSVRPRTPVTLSLGEKTGPFVRFRWPAAVGKVLDNPASEPSDLDQHLEKAWKRLGFEGAALVYGWGSPARNVVARMTDGKPAPELFAARDRDLCLNVLRRQRSGLLLAHASLCPLEVYSGREALWTNDPQLVRLAQETGTRRLEP